MTVPSPEKVEIAGKVLGKIRLFDPSFPVPNEPMILSWAAQLMIVNVSEEVALEAVERMYAGADNPHFQPLPGILLMHCRNIRQERSMAQPQYSPPTDRSDDPYFEPPPDDEKITKQEWERRHGVKFPTFHPKQIPADITDFEQKMMDEAGGDPMSVTCPHCRSGPGVRCTLPGGTQPLKRIRAHPSRYDALKESLTGKGSL